MQKRTDFPSKNEFSISRVSFQMTCFFHSLAPSCSCCTCEYFRPKVLIMSMMNRQNYCRLERKKKSTINDIIQRKIIALILQIFLFSQMKCVSAHPLNAVNAVDLDAIYFLSKCFSTIHPLFKRAIFLRYCRSFFAFCFMIELQDENCL